MHSNNYSYPTHSCLEIRNSKVFFIIRDSRFYNTPATGIELNNVSNGALINNNLSSNSYGIRLYNSNNTILSGNSLINNYLNGIYLDESNHNIISGNNASYNGFNGLTLNLSNNNTISTNNMSYNGDIGICLETSNNNTLSGNDANNNYIGIFIGEILTVSWQERYFEGESNNNNVLGNTANNNYNKGIFIIGNNNKIIENNANYNNEVGISLDWGNINTISDNNASYNGDCGIYLRSSNNATITLNFVSYNRFCGIYLRSSNNATITLNFVSNNSGIGLFLELSDNNVIMANEIEYHQIGLYLYHSYYNTILYNVFSHNLTDLKEESEEENVLQSAGISFSLLDTIITISTIIIVIIGAIFIRRRSSLLVKEISTIEKGKAIYPEKVNISDNKVIIVKNLKKFFGDVKAVNGISFDVRRGEIFGLLGPNGAGKTTTLKLLLGLLEPNEGEMEIFGLNPEDDELQIKHRVGYVSEEPLIFESLTPKELFDFIASVRGLDETVTTKLIKNYLDSLTAIECYDELIASLSHGNKQKIQVIAAILHKPDLLILDEPLSGLDTKSVKVVKSILEFYIKQGGSVLFSTHIMEIAQDLCDRIGIIHRGKIVGIGTLYELRQQVEKVGASLEDVFLRLTEQDTSVNEIIQRLRISYKKIS
ncbi:MAG: NosD domain-containing protein [Candidatus Hodarchaeota archaeon]